MTFISQCLNVTYDILISLTLYINMTLLFTIFINMILLYLETLAPQKGKYYKCYLLFTWKISPNTI